MHFGFDLGLHTFLLLHHFVFVLQRSRPLSLPQKSLIPRRLCVAQETLMSWHSWLFSISLHVGCALHFRHTFTTGLIAPCSRRQPSLPEFLAPRSSPSFGILRAHQMLLIFHFTLDDVSVGACPFPARFLLSHMIFCKTLGLLDLGSLRG